MSVQLLQLQPKKILSQNKQRYQYNFSKNEMRRYFSRQAKLPPLLMLFGALVFMIGLVPLSQTISSSSEFFIALGVILFIAGWFPEIVYYSKPPTDKQYVRWVNERSKPLYKKALQRLHLDASQCESIIEVQGGYSSLLQLTKKFPEKEIAVKRLPNGLRHYSINVCTYIFLTKDDIAIYSGYINAFAQTERFEDADHYYYKDIVGVSTSGPIYTSAASPSGKELQRQGFFVRVSNGEAVGTDYATRVVSGNAENRVQIQGVDEVVATLLSLLRSHKLTGIEENRITGDIL